jgi:hypothetical protein
MTDDLTAMIGAWECLLSDQLILLLLSAGSTMKFLSFAEEDPGEIWRNAYCRYMKKLHYRRYRF